MPHKEAHLLVDGQTFKKQTLNIPLSMVKILIKLWMVYVTTKIVALPNTVAGEEGNPSGISPLGQW